MKQAMTELNVCVFCGSRTGNNPAYTDAAHALSCITPTDFALLVVKTVRVARQLGGEASSQKLVDET